MHYLTFDLGDTADGVITIEAMASTSADMHPAAMAEAQRILAWAHQHFPDAHGPIEEGFDWDHDLQVRIEEGGAWHTVTLTLAASPRFAEAFVHAFGAQGA